MKFVDVVNLTQNAVAQALGTEYMTKLGDFSALSSYQLMDVGKDVLDSGSVDSFVKALLVQIGKLYIDSREYVSELSNIYVDSFDWGGFVERVYFSPAELIDDSMYNLVDKQSYDDHIFYEPKVSAKIFEEAKKIMCPISIASDEQISMAFNSYEQLNSFISGIHQNVKRTIDVGLDAYAHMLLSCGIAVSDKAIGTSVHLLTEAKGRGIVGADVTSAQALDNEAYLTYCLMRIRQTEKQMHRFTTAFNNGSIPVQAKEVNKVLLSDFVTATKFMVKANTYNMDEIGIGDYDEVCSWQAVKKDNKVFDYATNSAISISADPNNKLGIGTNAVEINNVIGVAYDRMAMGVCPFKSKVTTSVTAIADFQNFYHHLLVNYILDSNYPIVAFIND